MGHYTLAGTSGAEADLEAALCGAPHDFGPPAPVGDITSILQALADPTRLSLIRSLATTDEPRPCCSLDYRVTKSTMSHHFRVLREAGIIEQRLEGTRKLTSLRRQAVDEVYPGLLDSVLGSPDSDTSAATADADEEMRPALD